MNRKYSLLCVVFKKKRKFEKFVSTRINCSPNSKTTHYSIYLKVSTYSVLCILIGKKKVQPIESRNYLGIMNYIINNN